MPGGDYKKVYAIKENFDNKIFQRWTVKTATEVANNNCENQSRPLKRKYDPTDFCEMTRFVLEILKEVEETKEGTKQKIMKLALREDEYITQIWRAVNMKECRKKQTHEFVEFVNIVFNVVSIRC